MITYADFEFAIARWRARASGVPMPTSVSGAVETEVPVPTAPHEASAAVSDRPRHASGSIIVSDSLIDPPQD